MTTPAEDFQAIWGRRHGGAPIGHAHFWERALSRRQFVGTAVGAAGALATSSLWLPGIARATTASGVANPIRGGTQIDGLGFFHFFFPTANPFSTATIQNGGGDPSTVGDFSGSIGVGEWAGGTGRDDEGSVLFWNADVRFMTGEFIDTRGRHRQGAFAFV